MRSRIIIISLALFIYCTTASAHPVHVSVSNFEFTGERSLIGIKLFKDDLQLAIYHNFNIEIPIDSIGNDNYSAVIHNYISGNLIIYQNHNNELPLEFSGNEFNEEAIWIYYSADNLKNVSSILLVNTLFLDIYEDQTNLVIINFHGKQEGYRFNIIHTEKEIKLDE